MPPREEKKLSSWYQEREEFRRRLTISVFLVLFVIGIAGGIFTSRHKIANLFKPKTLEIKDFQATEFTRKDGSFGGVQPYRATVEKETSENHHTFHPLEGCPDILVVDVKFKIRNKSDLENKLSVLEGVQKEGVMVEDNKIIINRVCVSTRETVQLWNWEEVWKNVEPTLDQYYSPKKK